MANTAFRYDSIDYITHDFRLLKLLHSTAGGIECELYHAKLDTEPYEALSYAWGSLELVESVQIGGKTLRITDNLSAALSFLRLPGQPRVLWIDAICINQEDDVERSEQVRNMRAVFRQAEQVIVWLGKATLEVELLMNWLRQHEERSGPPDRPRDQARLLDMRDGFLTLLKRPWFTRIWILQEVANARQAVVCSGRASVTASAFARAPELLDLSIDSHCDAVLDLMLHRQESDCLDGSRAQLSALLIRFAGCQASDERDKIFALEGMSSDHGDTMKLLPDYTMPTETLVQRTVQYMLETQSQDLEVVLDFLSSFQTITVLCLLPPSPGYREDPYHSSAIEPAARFDNVRRMNPTVKASLLHIEPQAGSAEVFSQETCYTAVDHVKWHRSSYYSSAQNVKLLLVDDAPLALLDFHRFGLHGMFDLLFEDCIKDTRIFRFLVKEASARNEYSLLERLLAQDMLVFSKKKVLLNSTLPDALNDGHEAIVRVLLAWWSRCQ